MRETVAESDRSLLTGFAPSYRMLSIRDGTLAWWEQGGGDDTIVWLHGMPLDSRSWNCSAGISLRSATTYTNPPRG